MGPTCLHQAAQAQAWVPHLLHLQDILVIPQAQELPQLVVDIQAVLVVIICLPPPPQTSHLVPLIVRVTVAPLHLHHWSLQDQMDNLCMMRPANSQPCHNHLTTREVARHPREDISRATHMGLGHHTAVPLHLVAA